MDEKEINKDCASSKKEPDDLWEWKYKRPEERVMRIIPVVNNCIVHDDPVDEPVKEKQRVLIVGGDMANGLAFGTINVGALSRAMLCSSLGMQGMNLFEDERGREVIPIMSDMHYSTVRPQDHKVGERVVRSACDIYATRDTSGAAERRAKRKSQKKARKASRRK